MENLDQLKKTLLSNLNRSDIAVVIFLIFWQITTYMIPNKIMIKEPIHVAHTFIDQMIPLSVLWVWPYISFYFYVFGAYLFLRSEFNKKMLFLSYLMTGFFSTFIFFLYPTMINRELYPIPDITGPAAFILSQIRGLDVSINCFPSMHVTLSVLATLALCREWPQLKWVPIIWLYLICFSTMGTKQHYFYDVAGGLAYALFFWSVSKKILETAPAHIRVENYLGRLKK